MWLYAEIVLGLITTLLLLLWLIQISRLQQQHLPLLPAHSVIPDVQESPAPPQSLRSSDSPEHDHMVGVLEQSLPCPGCHTANRPGARHCQQCGQPLDGALIPRGAYLYNEQGVAVPLGRCTTIGSFATNTLILSDPTVSAAHAEIIQHDDRFILIDCGSTTGSFVDGHRAFRNRLRPGVRVRFGASEWMFQIHDIQHPGERAC